MARGLSNSARAGRLHRSEKPVKTHVGHVFAKLEVVDRVQAVIAAYESGIVRAGDP